MAGLLHWNPGAARPPARPRLARSAGL